MKKACSFCEKGFLERKTIKETYTYKGYSIEIVQPGEFCHFCGEGILNGADIKATEKQILAFQAKIDGLLTSSEIIKVRQKLKLSLKQAAEICGDEPNRFSRYECGEAIPRRSTSNFGVGHRFVNQTRANTQVRPYSFCAGFCRGRPACLPSQVTKR